MFTADTLIENPSLRHRLAVARHLHQNGLLPLADLETLARQRALEMQAAMGKRARYVSLWAAIQDARFDPLGA